LSRSRLLLLAAGVMVSGHELTLSIGRVLSADSAALHATEHGTPWMVIVALVGGLLVAIAAIALQRVAALRARLDSVSVRLPAWERPDPATVARVAARLFALAVVGFLLQENAEHLIGHGHLPLLAPLLEGQYVVALPVFAAISTLLGALAIALSRNVVVLVTALAAASHRALRPACSFTPPPVPHLDGRSALLTRGGRSGRRAPPVLLAA
jgi:hypothetical protein